MIFFICILALLINRNFLTYNENFLLCIFFMIFFMIAYIMIKSIFKQVVFKKIYKNFFLIWFVSCITTSFNKLKSYVNIIKYNLLKKYKMKILVLKRLSLIFLDNSYLTVFYFLYFYSLNTKMQLNLNHTSLDFIFNLKKNGIFLFF